MMNLPLNTTPPTVLTIAGSDSGGGAGIQADLKAIAANGCYGTSVITALTSQNTLGVQGVHPIPPDFVSQQIKSILDDIPPDAMKTGMLYDANVVRSVVESLKSQPQNKELPPLVCDPVCVSTSGHSLLDPGAIDALISDLFPMTTLVTPNKSEAELLLSHKSMEPKQISSVEDMISASQNLLQLGPSAVLLKGGHFNASLDDVNKIKDHANLDNVEVVMQHIFPENSEILQLHGDVTHPQTLVVDVLTESVPESKKTTTTIFVRPRLESNNTHGTGCTLSAAIASNLACGTSLRTAVQEAVDYTYLGIQMAYPVGSGHGPLNHFHCTTTRMIPTPTKTNPHPFTQMLIEGNAREWREYVQHDFVKLLGKGSLPKDAFIRFIVQDYHYLKYYARAYALLAAKSSTFEAIGTATETILNVLKEIKTHRSLCAEFGVSREALESATEAQATTAYGAYIMDVGLAGDSTKLLMALLACLLGYGEVGLWLRKQASLTDSWVIMEGNPYKRWMDDYGGEHYQNAVKLGLEVIEAAAQADPPSPARFEEWRGVWEKCTRLEKGFWDAAMDSS